jgi:ribokinase
VSKLIAGGGDEVHITAELGAPGGSGANTIFGLGKLGLNAGFIGAVGDDPEGKILLNSFQEAQVDITGIKQKSDYKTSIVHGFVDQNGERALYINPGANNSITRDDLDLHYLSNSNLILLTSFVDDQQLELQKTIVNELLQNDETKIIFSPGALYSKRSYEELTEIIENCYLCLLNDDEIKNLTGKSYEDGADQLIEQGVKIVAVTLGKNGCYIADGNETYHEPILDLEEDKVIDTTGAGDAFATGLIFGLLSKMPLGKCGKLGNYVAAECIQKMGARDGLPTKTEIDNIFE